MTTILIGLVSLRQSASARAGPPKSFRSVFDYYQSAHLTKADGRGEGSFSQSVNGKGETADASWRGGEMAGEASTDRVSEARVKPYSGVGLGILKKEGKLVVVEVLKDGPAWRSKRTIESGDTLLSINGQDIPNSDVASAQKMLMGPTGTTVFLQFMSQRFGQEYQVEVQRGSASVPAASGKASAIGHDRSERQAGGSGAALGPWATSDADGVVNDRHNNSAVPIKPKTKTRGVDEGASSRSEPSQDEYSRRALDVHLTTDWAVSHAADRERERDDGLVSHYLHAMPGQEHGASHQTDVQTHAMHDAIPGRHVPSQVLRKYSSRSTSQSSPAWSTFHPCLDPRLLLFVTWPLLCRSAGSVVLV